jgi:Domain of unknown function (DUF927)
MWKATANGLEGVAVVHSDARLCLDEIAQLTNSKEAGDVAYMLAMVRASHVPVVTQLYEGLRAGRLCFSRQAKFRLPTRSPRISAVAARLPASTEFVTYTT